MPSQVEEVVVAPNLRYPQQILQHACNTLLGLSLRRLVGRLQLGPRIDTLLRGIHGCTGLFGPCAIIWR